MRVLCVVQGRYGSKRLPGKVVYPLKGTSMLGFLLRRIASIGDLGGHFIPCLATTRKPEDDALAAWASSLKIPVVRGAEDDLVARFVSCLDHLEADAAIRVTADNPMTSRAMLRGLYAGLVEGHDYVDGYSSCIPGVGADGMSGQLLRRLHGLDLNATQKEHLNRYILDHPDCCVMHKVQTPLALQRTDISLTIDTPEEYAAFVARLATVHLPIEEIGVEHVLG